MVVEEVRILPMLLTKQNKTMKIFRTFKNKKRAFMYFCQQISRGEQYVQLVHSAGKGYMVNSEGFMMGIGDIVLIAFDKDDTDYFELAETLTW